MSNSKYLFFITGSIAAFKAAQVVSRLVKDGHEVKCVATASALKFVGAATFEGLTGQPVLTDLWEPGRAMDHIQLSRWADAGVVCPASANTVAQMALGLAPDVVSSALLAWPNGKPLFVFPAMNTAMLLAQPTQQHLQTLSSRGVRVAPTGSGSLACGEVGEGRILEPEDILAIICGLPEGGLTRTASAAEAGRVKNRVLITGGATREKIDGVRFISNVSTGRTAAMLCDHFTAQGWSVTYVHGEQTARALAKVNEIEFTDVESLNATLQRELGREDYAGVIHAAAVSDFTVDRINGEIRGSGGKIQSGGGLELSLKPTAKILPNLKEYSRNKNIRVIGFKLLHDASAAELRSAAGKVLESGADAVVANDWVRLNENRGAHPGFVLSQDGARGFTGVPQLASLLNEILSTKDGL